MSEGSYYDVVVHALRDDPAIRALGFRDGETDIRWYGKGANHHDLMQLTKPSWTVLSAAGSSEGYEGVNIHFESRNHGSFQIDCELTPRLGSESKHDQKVIAPLLMLKADLTLNLRAKCLRSLDHLGVSTKSVRKDSAAPSSLKVVGFDLGLPAEHSPELFTARVSPVIVAATPLIEEVLRSRGLKDMRTEKRVPSSILSAIVPDDGPLVLPPVPGAAPLLERIYKTRGKPERNMEDLVKRFLVMLGHDEHNIEFQVGHVDVRVADASGSVSMIIEVKRNLHSGNQRSATNQAFGYAERAQAPLVVVADADLYEVHDRRRGDTRAEMFVGRFQLTRFRPDDERVLDVLRPEFRRCSACLKRNPGVAKFCAACGGSVS